MMLRRLATKASNAGSSAVVRRQREEHLVQTVDPRVVEDVEQPGLLLGPVAVAATAVAHQPGGLVRGDLVGRASVPGLLVGPAQDGA